MKIGMIGAVAAILALSLLAPAVYAEEKATPKRSMDSS